MFSLEDVKETQRVSKLQMQMDLHSTNYILMDFEGGTF